jgi:hypothetical protein
MACARPRAELSAATKLASKLPADVAQNKLRRARTGRDRSDGGAAAVGDLHSQTRAAGSGGGKPAGAAVGAAADTSGPS